MTVERYSISDIPSHEKMIHTDGEPTLVLYDNYGRGLNSYEQIFRLRPHDLDDKIVIDLGSAKNQVFANDIEKSSLYHPKEVISVDPLYEEGIKDEIQKDLQSRGINIPETGISNQDYPEYKKAYFNRHPHNNKIIVARGEQLPFNGSVDLILACNSVPLYLRTKDSIFKAFEEMLIALKSGGEARVFPLAYSPLGHGYDPDNGTIEPSKFVFPPNDNGVFEAVFFDLQEKYDFKMSVYFIDIKNPEDPDEDLYVPGVIFRKQQNIIS